MIDCSACPRWLPYTSTYYDAKRRAVVSEDQFGCRFCKTPGICGQEVAASEPMPVHPCGDCAAWDGEDGERCEYGLDVKPGCLYRKERRVA